MENVKLTKKQLDAILFNKKHLLKIKIFLFILYFIFYVLFLIAMFFGADCFDDYLTTFANQLICRLIISFIFSTPFFIILVIIPLLYIVCLMKYIYKVKNDNYKLYRFIVKKDGFCKIKNHYKHHIYLDNFHCPIDVLFFDEEKNVINKFSSKSSIIGETAFLLIIENDYLCFIL